MYITKLYLEHSNPVTPSGMKRGVVPPILAVPSITHHDLSTTDDVEMRLCQTDTSGTTLIELVELYVQ